MDKLSKQEFLKMQLESKLEFVNEILIKQGTKGINEKCDFSYSWVKTRLKEDGAVYVMAEKRFLITEVDTLTMEEVIKIRQIIKEYGVDKNKGINECDIRFFVGICGEEITRSFTIDKEVNEQWTIFCKEQRGITSKDLMTGALSRFMKIYKGEKYE